MVEIYTHSTKMHHCFQDTSTLSSENQQKRALRQEEEENAWQGRDDCGGNFGPAFPSDLRFDAHHRTVYDGPSRSLSISEFLLILEAEPERAEGDREQGLLPRTVI